MKRALSCRELKPFSVRRTDSGTKPYLPAEVRKQDFDINLCSLHYFYYFSLFCALCALTWHLIIFFFFLALGCPALEIPTNIQMSCSPSLSSSVSDVNSRPFGMVCTFSCDDGHELQGALTTECTLPGQWTSSPPTCTGIHILLFVMFNLHAQMFWGSDSVKSDLLCQYVTVDI